MDRSVVLRFVPAMNRIDPDLRAAKDGTQALDSRRWPGDILKYDVNGY